MKKINNFISLFFGISISLILSLYGYELVNKVHNINSNWNEYNTEGTKYSYLLSQIKGNFGYGGFIHHFKNYVLRKNRKYEKYIEENISNLNKLLDQFQDLNLTPKEQAAIKEIELTFKEYEDNYYNAKEIFDTKNNSELDKIVKVDDTKAFKSFKILQESILTRSKKLNAKTSFSINNLLDYLSYLIILALIILSLSFITWKIARNLIRSQKDLEHSENYLKSIFDTTSDGILSVDKDGYIKSWNNKVESLTEFSSEELKDLQVEELIPMNFRKQHVLKREKYTQAPKAMSMSERLDLVLMTKSGKEIAIEVGLNAINLNNDKEVIATIRDIRHRKKIEVELIESKNKAIEANEAKGLFLANMSHEIRTPLNGIIGMTYILLNKPLKSDIKNSLVKIDHSAKHLVNIINNILDFSKFESKNIYLEQIDFSLEEIINNISELTVPLSKDKNIEILIHIDKDIPDLLIGDPLRLKQILINLMSNAIKFTSEGNVTLNVSRINEGQNQIMLKFEVIDTGIGISRDKIDKIFQSFSQADDSISRNFGGTGLGLAITKQIIDLMGGKIEVESTIHKGSRFSIYLEFEKSFNYLSYKEDLKDFSKLKTLVVDDNHFSRRITEEILRDLNISTNVCDSGNKAIEIIEESYISNSPFDLILMDWKMPKLDGIDTLNLLLNNSKIKDMPKVFIVTAYGKENFYNNFSKINIDGLIEKPLTSSSVYNLINDIYSQTLIESKHSSNDSELNQWRGIFSDKAILIAEDNKINQEIILELIEISGAKIELANNGSEAIKILENNKNQIDLILMDIHMPELDGIEASQIIRNKLKMTDMPIIAMTADLMLYNEQACKARGMDGYVSKPINAVNLYKILSSFLLDSPRQNKSNSIYNVPVDNHTESFEIINESKGIKYINNNIKLYYKLLNDFLNEYQQKLTEMSKYFDDNNYDELYNLNHQLKGLSGNLAMEKLYTASKTLDAIFKLKDEKKYEKSYLKLEKELKSVLQKISKSSYHTRGHNTENNHANEFNLKQLVSKLEIELEKNDLNALKTLNLILSLNKIKDNSELLELKKMIENLNFSESLIYLKKILPELNKL